MSRVVSFACRVVSFDLFRLLVKLFRLSLYEMYVVENSCVVTPPNLFSGSGKVIRVLR